MRTRSLALSSPFLLSAGMVTFAGKLSSSPVGPARFVPVRVISRAVPRWMASGAGGFRTGAWGLGLGGGSGFWAEASGPRQHARKARAAKRRRGRNRRVMGSSSRAGGVPGRAGGQGGLGGDLVDDNERGGGRKGSPLQSLGPGPTTTGQKARGPPPFVPKARKLLPGEGGRRRPSVNYPGDPAGPAPGGRERHYLPGGRALPGGQKAPG